MTAAPTPSSAAAEREAARMARAKRPRTFFAGSYGHPVHPILVTIPIGTWVASLVFDLVAAFGDEPEVFARGAYWLIVVGCVGAAVAERAHRRHRRQVQGREAQRLPQRRPLPDARLLLRDGPRPRAPRVCEGQRGRDEPRRATRGCAHRAAHARLGPGAGGPAGAGRPAGREDRRPDPPESRGGAVAAQQPMSTARADVMTRRMSPPAGGRVCGTMWM